MGNEAEPTGRPRRLGMVAVAMVAMLVDAAAVAGEEEAAGDDSASEALPRSVSV